MKTSNQNQLKHTVKPWAAREQSQAQWIIESSEGSIAWLDRHYSATQTEGAANARLIAAAPELLEELESIVRLVETTDVWLPRAWLLSAKDAIAKATGEAAP